MQASLYQVELYHNKLFSVLSTHTLHETFPSIRHPAFAVIEMIPFTPPTVSSFLLNGKKYEMKGVCMAVMFDSGISLNLHTRIE